MEKHYASFGDTSICDPPRAEKEHRVGGGVTPAVLPHHRAYGSVHGGSCSTLKFMIVIQQRHEP